jgi:hypothetical protein
MFPGVEIIPSKEPEPPLPKPNIDWFTWGFPAVAYDAERGLWTDYGDVHAQIYKACAIYVTNNLDDATARGTHAARLRAQISWAYAHEAIGPRFSPAPWIGEELGQIELPVGVTKRILIAVRDTTGQYWTGCSNSRLELSQGIQMHSDMVPFDGTMIIKLIDSSDELLAKAKWSWEEDVNTHWPMIKCPASSILSGQRQLDFPIFFERYQQQSGLWEKWESRGFCRLFPQPGGRRVFVVEKNMDRHLASADSKPASRFFLACSMR